jgi:hypothetical protein
MSAPHHQSILPKSARPALRNPADNTEHERRFATPQPNSEQNDVKRETMACDEAGGLGRGMPTTAGACVHDSTTLVMAIASEIGRRAARA